MAARFAPDDDPHTRLQWHTLDQVRAGPARKGFIPVKLGLVAEVKFSGRYQGRWIRDGVILSVNGATRFG